MPVIKKAPKVIICAVIAIALVGSAASFKYSWMLPAIASVGGVVVFWGLWIEKRADERLEAMHKEPFRVRIIKRLENFGWWVLMAGIAAEIITAFTFSARDVYEEWENSPRNQPVSTVEAMAEIAIESPLFPQPRPVPFEDSSLELTGTNIGSGLSFFTLTLRSYPRVIGMNGFQYGKSNAIAVGMEFQEYGTAPVMWLDASNNIINLARPVVSDVLDEVKTMYFYIDFISTNSEILGGQTILRVNGFQKTFRIPKQNRIPWATTFPAQTDGNGIGFFATNEP
jgi:hypothetical protein